MIVRGQAPRTHGLAPAREVRQLSGMAGSSVTIRAAGRLSSRAKMVRRQATDLQSGGVTVRKVARTMRGSIQAPMVVWRTAGDRCSGKHQLLAFCLLAIVPCSIRAGGEGESCGTFLVPTRIGEHEARRGPPSDLARGTTDSAHRLTAMI
jgi:hypothetical protein